MNAFVPATSAEVQAAMQELKSHHAGASPLTNYFHQPLEQQPNLRLMKSENSLCVSHSEWDFTRLYFYSFDEAGLTMMLKDVEQWPAIVVCDWLSKEGSARAGAFLEPAGFHLHAIYDRLICRPLRKDQPNSALHFADESDVELLHYWLLKIFDKYCDHIMSVDELREVILRKEAMISRDSSGEIKGFGVFPVSGQNCNFNFLYNNGDPITLAKSLGNFYGVMNQRGVRSAFGWVRRTRPTVLKLHETFGWRRDGLVDYIFMR